MYDTATTNNIIYIWFMDLKEIEKTPQWGINELVSKSGFSKRNSIDKNIVGWHVWRKTNSYIRKMGHWGRAGWKNTTDYG